MRHLLGLVDSVSEWSGKLVSMLILFMTGVLFLEVMLRYVFNAPTIWAHELTLHLFGAYSVIAGAYVLRHRQHINIDIIYGCFSPRGRAVIDSVTYLLFFFFILATLRYGIMTAWRAVEIRQTVSPSPWGSPLWPLKLTIPVAAFLMLAQGLADFIRVLRMAITGKELP